LLHRCAGQPLRCSQHDPLGSGWHVHHVCAHDGGLHRGRVCSVDCVHCSVRDRVRRDAGSSRVGHDGRYLPGRHPCQRFVALHWHELVVQPHRGCVVPLHFRRSGRLRVRSVRGASCYFLPVGSEVGTGDVGQVSRGDPGRVRLTSRKVSNKTLSSLNSCR
ncbi:hypothetical protein L914_17586, partial [Phytophthora nicotianae]